MRALLEALHIKKSKPVIAVVRLAGVIGARPGTLQAGGITAAAFIQPLERAFAMKGAVAVALAINSPGGAPAQSSLIVKRIRSLAKEYELPVFAFAEDVAASGGYMLACAADEIYADDTSVVGSIGVISAGFGFPELLKKVGVERRVYTAGTSKGMLDPFQPEKPDEVEHLKELQRDVHDAFKDLVRERRAGKLKASEDDLFTGAFWTGRRALSLGLIDGIGELTDVMKARFGDKVRFRPIGQRESWLRRRLGIESRIADGFLTAIEERLWWARFGL
jgi:signal peptide peptidase SppA